MSSNRQTIPDHIYGENASRIVDLMRERERAFVAVWRCEQRIRTILNGADFPFPEPPEIPSRRRRGKRHDTPRAEPIRVRRLKPDEDAYRLTITIDQQPKTFLQENIDAVRALVALPPGEAQPLRLESVRLDKNGHPTPVDCLWRAEPPS